MQLKLDATYEQSVKQLDIPYIKYDNTLYLAVDDIKKNYDKLQETINISSKIKFNSLVFSTDFEVIKAV